MTSKISCYIHYMISKDEGKTSSKIFDEIYTSITDGGLIHHLNEINVIVCGNKNFCSFPILEKCNFHYYSDDVYLHEFPTLSALYNDCINLDDNSKILYLHLKGVTSNNDTWRKKMLTATVYNHKECISSLEEGYDSVGTLLSNTIIDDKKIKFYSGNFWWATSKFIKTLPEPTKENLMLKFDWMIKNRANKNSHAPSSHSFRYLAELWIAMSSVETQKMKEIKVENL
jgi:hypothetical protein